MERREGPMQNIVTQRVCELSADMRQAVERVLGRTLREEEVVSIMAFSPHDAPEERDRQALAREIEQRIKETASRANNVPDEQVEELVNEAINHARSPR